jgi:hypothetical protein
MDTPGFDASLGDDDSAAFRHGDKMLEDERRAPSHRLCRIADGAIFVAIGIFHQNRANPVWPQLRTHGAVILPKAFIIVADLRAIQIDSAAFAWKAMFAEFASGLREFFDFEHLATEVAFGAGFPGNCYHRV